MVSMRFVGMDALRILAMLTLLVGPIFLVQAQGDEGLASQRSGMASVSPSEPAAAVSSKKITAGSEGTTTSLVSLNTADANALASLAGIGPAKANAILEYRKAHGPFKSIDELLEVKGIGTAILDKNRARLRLD